MLIFNKLLPLFLLPFGLVCGLVLFAIWKKKAWPGMLAVVVLYLCSTPLVGFRLFGWLENRYPELPVAEAGPADAVIVLGGVLGPISAPGRVTNWLETVERFEAGVQLVQSGRVQYLVFTGARIQLSDRVTTEGAELREQAIVRGVPPAKIIVTEEIDNTATEARAVAALMKQRGWKRVILVTSGWHMPRAAMTFRRAGVDCQPFPVDFRMGGPRPVGFGELLPGAIAWLMTETALREGYGYLFYRLFR